MKKRTIIIICIIIGFFVLWCIGYSLMSLKINNIEKKGFINDCKSFLEQDETFLNDYGNIVRFETDDKYPPKTVDVEDKKEYYMDFNCETEKAIFEVSVFSMYDNGWTYRYVVNTETLVFKSTGDN